MTWLVSIWYKFLLKGNSEETVYCEVKRFWVSHTIHTKLAIKCSKSTVKMPAYGCWISWKLTKTLSHYYFPTNNYLFKVTNKNNRTWCKICSKLTIKTSERRQRRRSGVFIVNSDYISHHVLVYLSLTWSN